MTAATSSGPNDRYDFDDSVMFIYTLGLLQSER